MSDSPIRKIPVISLLFGMGIVLGVTVSLQISRLPSSVAYAQFTNIFIPNCSDTDGGINIGKRGHILIGLTREFDESCKDSSTLTEFDCVPFQDAIRRQQPEYTGTEIACAQGCQDGVCIGAPDLVDQTGSSSSSSSSSQSSASSQSASSVSSSQSSVSSSASSSPQSSLSSSAAPFPGVTDIWFEQHAKCNDITNGGNDCVTFDLWVDLKMPDGSRLPVSDSVWLTLSEWIPDQGKFMFPAILNKRLYGTAPMFMMTMTMLKTEVTPTFKFLIEIERGSQRQQVERTVSSTPRSVVGASSSSSSVSSSSQSSTNSSSSRSSSSSSQSSSRSSSSSSSSSSRSASSSSAAQQTNTSASASSVSASSSSSTANLTGGQRVLTKIRERLIQRIDDRISTAPASAQKLLAGIKARLIKRIHDMIRNLGGGL
ncbi:MAG: hypothetical protein PHZ00_08155 [Candidatus Peribacteraceae bacterium]|nr:hypothetical protein [Candidatus Peribacteraceae bacterium]